MRVSLRRVGNSSGVIIPTPLLQQIGARPGGDVEIGVEDGRIVIAPVEHRRREGWAEASRRIAEAGEDQLIWPQIANADDETFTWCDE
jgi:antitoxin MazE